jgi:hypothetical protein
LAGSSQSTQDTQNNNVAGNTILNGNFNGAWTGQNNASILSGFNGTHVATLNLISDNVLRPAGGDWSFNKGSTGTNTYGTNVASAGTSGTTTGSGT